MKGMKMSYKITIFLFAGFYWAMSGCDDDSESAGVEGMEITSTQCQDDRDNDGDGLTDCADPECRDYIFCADNGGDSDTDADEDSDEDSDIDTVDTEEGTAAKCWGSGCAVEDDGSLSCDSGSCSMFCEGIPCTCDGGSCILECTGGASCDCAGDSCNFFCTGGSECSCASPDNCWGACAGPGTTCCGMSGSCGNDASCSLTCSD